MSSHLKRLAQPRRWKTPKKTSVWALKPRAGPHAVADSLPLLVALRDDLHLADRAREAKRIINEGQVHVDGAACRDPRRGLGLMDVLSIPAIQRHYRVLYDHHGRLTLVPIEAADAAFKLSRIEDKVVLSSGRTQLNLHDGRNVVIKEGAFQTGDVLKLKLPGQEILDHFPLKPGTPTYITGGSHTGQIATLVSEKVVLANSPNRVTLRGAEEFETIRPYVFVVGKDRPIIAPVEVPIRV